LERGLKFEKIAIASILETLVYNFVLVFLAWKGFGIRSFAWAILIRGGTGLIIIYSLQPWRPGFALSKESLKKLLRFGIPYQLNTFIAIMKDDGLTIVLGKILGLEAMGILTWAQKWAQMPLRIFMDQVTKVTFPAFSRMQESREHLQRSLSRSIFFICFFVYPSLIGLIIISPNLIMIIPRYEKWTPALLPLALIGINSIFSAVSTQLTNFLNSTGRIKTTFKLMVMWLSLTWAIIPFLAFKFGANGAALGYALLGASSVVVFYISKRIINYSLWESAGKPLVASLTMAGVLLILQLMLPVNVLSTLMLIVTGGIIYGLMIYFLVGRSLTDDVKKGVKTIFTK
jgi:O-antigen/teichoic acid export membrane protein